MRSIREQLRVTCKACGGTFDGPSREGLCPQCLSEELARIRNLKLEKPQRCGRFDPRPA